MLPHATTIQPPCQETCREHLARLNQCSRDLIRSYSRRSNSQDAEFSQLVDFVKYGLLDPRILPERLKTLIPKRVPSGSRTLDFKFERKR